MEVKKCTCGELMSFGLYLYEGNDITEAKKIPGYRCFSCGKTEYDAEAAQYLEKQSEQQKRLNKTKRGKGSHVQPILINKVKKVRMEKNIATKTMADALGFSDQRYRVLETSSHIPNVYLSLQLEVILGVNLHELFEVVYIPTSVYEEIKLLNKDFQIISGVSELMENLTAINDDLKELKKNFQSKKSKLKIQFELDTQQRYTNNSIVLYKHEELDDILNKTFNEINDKMDKLKKEKSLIKQKIDILTGKTMDSLGLTDDDEKFNERSCFLLSNGRSIDYDSWVKLIEIYGSRLNIN